MTKVKVSDNDWAKTNKLELIYIENTKVESIQLLNYKYHKI